MKVLLEKGVWLAEGEGDPPRTIVEENAKEFGDITDAFIDLEKALEFRPFKNWVIV